MAQRLVVVGGDAGGMGAASQARRLRPDADDLQIVAFELGERTSYALCGIPYVVAGEVPDVEMLVARTPDEHRARGIEVHLRHEVTGIDVDGGRVRVRDLDAATDRWEGFDQLVVGTGARPIRPDLPGIDRDDVHGVGSLGDAAVLRERIAGLAGEHAVIVGGGYIGIEMAEACVLRGLRVTVVDMAPQVMSTLDADMAATVSDAMANAGVDVRTGTEVQGFDAGAVLTGDGPLPSAFTVLGIGVLPRADLAGAAGLDLGARGAVAVDDHQRILRNGRPVGDLYAAGDCCESRHLVTGQGVHIALGTLANRQARVAGINLGGGDATFPGVLGTAVTRFLDTEVGRTGLTEREAAAAGLDVVATTIQATTRAGYYPGAAAMRVKLVAEADTGRIVGGQVVGGPGTAERVDVLAVAITAGIDAEAFVDLDLSYAPPFSPVWDPLAAAARSLLRRL